MSPRKTVHSSSAALMRVIVSLIVTLLFLSENFTKILCSSMILFILSPFIFVFIFVYLAGWSVPSLSEDELIEEYYIFVNGEFRTSVAGTKSKAVVENICHDQVILITTDCLNSNVLRN